MEYEYILLAILILLVMITIHEFGHYIAGKLLKFKINEFSIGFGPKLFSKKNKKTGEVFSLRAVPLGGYCAFEDEAGLDEAKGEVFSELKKSKADTVAKDLSVKNDGKKFNDQPPWKRIVVFAAGGVFNLVSAVIFCFIFILAIGMEAPHQTISYVFVDQHNVAYNDLLEGDKIIEVNGKKLTYMYTLSDAMLSIKGDEADFLIERVVDGNTETLTIKAYKKEIIAQEDDEGREYETFTGFGIIHTSTRDKSFLTALKYSVPYTGKLSWSVLSTLGKLITGQLSLTSVAGPVGTITTIASVSQANWQYILLLLPLIAANLGIFNLLPIPALDGSKIVFAIIEWIRKKPVNRRVENMIHVVGLFVLFGFVILVDIVGLFSRWGL